MASVNGHRLLIDDSVKAAGDTDGSAFVFTEDNIEGTCAPSWNYTCSTAQEFTLRFKGTGVSVFGAAVCITSSTPSSSTQVPISHMVVLDNDVVPSGTGGAYSEPHLYQVRGLQDGSHSLEYISMTCDEGGVSNISYVDFALSSLDLRTPIEPGLDMLLATYDDSSVVFSEDGGWEVVERAALERLESRTSTRVRANAGYLDGMETSEVGDWVSFSFFGDSVSAFGSLHWQDALIQFPQRPEWMVELSLSVTLDGSTSDHTFPNPSVVSFPFWDSGTLEPLPDGAPHVVNITLMETPVSSSGKFRVEGFMYRPTFQSVEEGNRMFATWNEGPSESDPKPAEDSPDEGGAKTNLAGPIAGGVIGGVVVFALIALFLWYRGRRQHDKNGNEEEKEAGYLRPPTTQATAEVPDEAAIHTSGAVRPYMKSYSDFDSSPILNTLPPSDPTLAVPYTKTYRDTSLDPTNSGISPSSTTVSPYMKSYRGTGNPSAPSPGHDPSTVAPFMKSYEDEFDPNSLVPVFNTSHEASGSQASSPVSTSSVPMSPTTSQSAAEEGQPHTGLDPPPRTDYPGAPPSFRSEEGENGSNTEAPTTRLMGIIQRMRAEMDAMEAPPPYGPHEGR